MDVYLGLLIFYKLTSIRNYRFAYWMSARAILERENSPGASRRRWPYSAAQFRGQRHSRCEIRKRARKSGEFPEQCVVSIRVSVGVAMRWTLVQLRKQGKEREKETGRERERRREEREDLSVAKLSSTSSPSRRPTTTPRDHSRYPSAERPSRPLRPLLLLQMYKVSHFVIELSRPKRTQIRWNRPANTRLKEAAPLRPARIKAPPWSLLPRTPPSS